MQPYCDHHDELMDDMDACEEGRRGDQVGRLTLLRTLRRIR